MLTQEIQIGFKEVLQGYHHQTEAFELSREMRAFALLMEMGTGKSKVLLDTVQWLFLKREIDGLLLVAPKSCYLNWETDEIPKHLPDSLPVRKAYWDADLSGIHLRILWTLTEAQDNVLDIVLMNIEALSTKRGEEFAKKFLKNHYAMMAIDESSCVSAHDAARTKACIRLGEMAEYRRILTGTPITQGPLDLWSQFRFLDQNIVGDKHFTNFKAKYANWITQSFGTRSYQKITGYKNIEQLKAKIAPYSYRKLKTECLDLPEKIFVERTIELCPEQREVYNRMKREAMLEFSDESLVTCESALTVIMKLHQIACGWVQDDYGKIRRLPNNRINELMTIVKDISGKILIWCYFKEDIRQVCESLALEYGTESVVHYYGDTTTSERVENLDRFKNDPSCRFFVSNETGSKSLTLIVANYAINYSYDYKLETWLQQQDRNHRIGQNQNCTYITMMARNTVDPNIIKNLKGKINLAAATVNDLKSCLE